MSRRHGRTLATPLARLDRPSRRPPPPIMRASPLVAAIAAAFAFSHLSIAQRPLNIVRVSPNGDAGPMQQISVAFDRPVAGSLDRTIDAATIFHIEPAVRGQLEWRDPVTIRLTPAAP